MLKNTTQSALYQFVTQIEELAVNLEFKMRLLDAIRDIKRKLEHPLNDYELKKTMVELDELLLQIKKIIEPEPKEFLIDDTSIVSELEVKKRVRELLDECSKTNVVIAQERLQGYKTYIDETERATRNMAKTEANYERMIQPKYFIESFETIGANHSKRMNAIAVDYLEEATVNYDRTVKQIGDMFSNISVPSLKIGKRELYMQWSERLDAIKQQLKNEIEVIDKGGELIRNFGQTCQEALSKIIHKTSKKYRRKKRMPLYIFLVLLLLLCVLAIGVVTEGFEFGGQLVTEVEEVVMDTQAAEIEQGNTIQNVREKLEEINNGIDEWKELRDSFQSFLSKTGLLGMISMLNMLFIPFLIIVGCIWYLHCKNLNKKCKMHICTKTENYLVGQLDMFWKEQHLQLKVEESYDEVVKRVTFVYENLLSKVFEGLLYDQKEDENSNVGKMLHLCKEWEKIKRGNV